jgi:hypothetical protein
MATGCAPPGVPPPLPPPATVMEVIAVPTELSLEAGGQAQISVQANDASGAAVGGTTFRFTSSDPRLLEVSERGLVSSVGPATTRADIIIASGRYERRVPVVVVPGAPHRLELFSRPEGATPVDDAGGDTGLIALRVTDAFSNPVPDTAINVRFAELAGPEQQTRTDARGIAQVKRQGGLHDATTLIVAAAGDTSVRQTFRIEAAAPEPAPAPSPAPQLPHQQPLP